MSDTGKANDLLAQIPRGERRPAARAPVESAVLRRHRHAHRPRRHLVLPGHADRTQADGEAVLQHHSPRRRRLFPGDSGGKGRYPRRRCALRRGDPAGAGRGRAQVLRFATNVEDEVEADAGHPLRVEIDPAARNPRPTCGCATTSRRWCIATCSTSWSSWRCRAGSTASNGSASGATASSFLSARSRTDRRSMKKAPEGAFSLPYMLG